MYKNQVNAFKGILILAFLILFLVSANTLHLEKDTTPSSLQNEIISGFSVASGSGVEPTWSFVTDKEWTGTAISNDGNTIFVSSNEILHLFDPSSNNPVWSFNASELIFPISVSDNGSLSVIGTIAGDGYVYLLGRESNSSLWSYNTADWVTDVEISGDGSTVAAVDRAGWVYVFDSTHSVPIWTYNSPDSLYSIDVSHDGGTIVAGGDNKTIYVFGRDTNETLWTYECNGEIKQVSISDDGSRIAVASRYLVLTFNRDSDEPVWSYAGHNFVASSISGDGSTVVIGTASTIKPWNLYAFGFSSNSTIWTYNGTNQFTRIDMTYNGSHILAGSYDMQFYLFLRNSNSSILQYNMSNYIWDVAISGDGTRFVASSWNTSAVFFDAISPEITSVETQLDIYSTEDTFEVAVETERGTFPLHSSLLHYTQNGIDWYELKLGNVTPLIDDAVEFTATIGPFYDGIVEYYVTVNDTLGLYSRSIVKQVTIDGTAPVFHSLYQDPQNPNSTQPVSITVNFTDSVSGMDTVLLNYSTDDSGSWIAIEMSLNMQDLYTALIPEQPNGTNVIYCFIANDTVGNAAMVDNSGLMHNYTVLDLAEATDTTTETTDTTDTTTETPTSPVPDDSMWLLLAVSGITILGAVAVFIVILRKRMGRHASGIDYDPPTDSPNTGGEI